MQMTKRIERHDGAECAAADAENDEILEFLSYVARGFENIVHDFFLVVGKLRPTHIQFVFTAIFLHVLKRRACFCVIGRKFTIGKALFAKEFFRHVVVVQRYAHGIAPISCFVSHKSLLVFCFLIYCTLFLGESQGSDKIFRAKFTLFQGKKEKN